MPHFALASQLHRWLTISTNFSAHLAAVAMVVEDMKIRSNFSTGRLLKTNGNDGTSKNTKSVRVLSRLKPHDASRFVFLVRLKKTLINGSKLVLIEATGEVNPGLAEYFSRERFIDRVPSKDVGIA